MRFLCAITIAAALAIGAWRSFPTQAKQPTSTSMDPGAMMSATTNLPTDPQYDQGTVFLPDGVHYN